MMLSSADRIKELIAKKEKLTGDLANVDEELAQLVGGMEPAAARKVQKCSKCGQEGHTKRTCTQT